MAPPGAESKTLRDLFGEDLDEEVDYESDSQFVGPNGSPLTTITGEDDESRAPSSVTEHGAADTLTALRNSPDVTSKAEIITNPLDEQQQQQVDPEDRIKQRSETLAHLAEQRDYVFHAPSDEERLRGVTGRSLSGWFPGPEATTPSEVAERTALRARLLQPTFMSVNRYRTRLERQARGAPVAAINGVPILIAQGENDCEEDNEFIRWVHRARRLSSMMALRASANAADVRLERKLRFEYAKLKAKGRLRSQTVRYAPLQQHESAAATSVATNSRRDLHVSSSIPATIGGKRQGSPADPERDVQKRQRRRGSPAEEAPQTPTSYTPRGTRATSPDTGFDRGVDVFVEVSPHGTERSPDHRATPAEAGVSAQEHADLVLEMNRLRESLAQTQSTLDAVQTRLQVLEQHQPRLEGQLDVLIRMMHPAAPSPFSARAPPHPRDSGHDRA